MYANTPLSKEAVLYLCTLEQQQLQDRNKGMQIQKRKRKKTTALLG